MKNTNTNTITVNTRYDSTYELIHFYNSGNIILTIEPSALVTYETDKNGNFNETNERTQLLKNIIITEPRRANKINLNRTDNYYCNTISKSFLPKKYDLYIYCGAGGDATITIEGEKTCHVWEEETAYKNAYKITLKHGYTIRRGITEKYPMENPKNYVLKENEYFREYGYGTKENPCVWIYDNAGHENLFKKLNPGKEFVHVKGIVKSYFIEEHETAPFLTAPRCYTRMEYPQKRKDRESLLKTINEKAGLKISDYDFKKLLEVVNITLK